MSRFMWFMGGALIACIIGESMLFWALERTSLIGFHNSATGDDARAPFVVYVLMFVGLILVNFSVFFALTRWSRYLREHPGTSQAPPWFLVSIAIFAGAALLTGIAQHSGWVRAQSEVPTDVNQGFIAYQVVMGTLVLVPLVLVAVRWSPGYKPRLDER